MEHKCEGAKPSWATDHGLQLCGQYYEGFVDDYEAVYTRHRIEIVTSYGVRRSRQNASGESNCHPDDKENIEVQDNNMSAKKIRYEHINLIFNNSSTKQNHHHTVNNIM